MAVCSREQLQDMAKVVQEEFCGLDILFANAGVAFAIPLSSTTEQQYDELMDINVKGLFFSIQAVERIMRPGGSIILNTSWLNQIGAPGQALLSAPKAAVRSFARTLSAEMLERRIRVNAVSPTPSKHPFTSSPARALIPIVPMSSGLVRRPLLAEWAVQRKSPRRCCSWQAMLPAICWVQKSWWTAAGLIRVSTMTNRFSPDSSALEQRTRTPAIGCLIAP